MAAGDLIALLNEDDKSTLTVLLHAREEAKAAYLENSTPQNLATMDKAQSMLDKFMANQAKHQEKPEAAQFIFKTQAAALAYLKEQGYKINKSQFSVHANDPAKGLTTNSQGHFEQAVLLNYALKHLRRLASVEDEKAAATVAALTSAQTLHKQAQAELAQLKLLREKSQFISREEYEAALAQRAAAFKNEVETFIFRTAQRAIRLVEGNQDKLPDLLQYWEDESASWLDSYTIPAEIKNFGG